MSANAASLSASFRPADTASSAFSWGRYARIGLLTIGASVLANAVSFYLAQVAVQYDPAFLPLGNVSAPVHFHRLPGRCCCLVLRGPPPVCSKARRDGLHG
jgi:hypothetical protein